MDRLLWDQLDARADKWTDEQGKQLLVIEFIERPRTHKITVPPSLSRTPRNPSRKAVTEPKTDDEKTLLAWFKEHECEEMTLPRARDKKTFSCA